MLIIIEMKEFECKGCGTFICLSGDKNRNPICPECRGVMLLVENSTNQANLKKFECSQCAEIFYMKKDRFPYKCPFCNYTFFVSPGLKQEERL
jgi:Zn finger protein HypA/HybF involved in hydrogenase expression